MVMVFTNGPMVAFIRVIGTKIKYQDTVNILGMMVVLIKDIG